MSLKAFHLVFIIVSTLFCGGFAYWALGQYQVSDSASFLVQGVGSAAAAIGLVFYAPWFLRKLESVSYL